MTKVNTMAYQSNKNINQQKDSDKYNFTLMRYFKNITWKSYK